MPAQIINLAERRAQRAQFNPFAPYLSLWAAWTVVGAAFYGLMLEATGQK